MADLRIFSYLPNPRVWKSQITAELLGVDLELVGDKPPALANWLWDFEARALPEDERTQTSPFARTGRRGFRGTLYKTDEFLQAHPFGTVPAAFSGDGTMGIFESNSILRAVARASEKEHPLYGTDHFSASRIDSFLDACLVFAREAQVYLLDADDMNQAVYDRMKAAYEFFLDGVEQALSQTKHIASDDLSIADIGIACDVSQFLRERLMAERLKTNGFSPISTDFEQDYPRLTAHLQDLGARPVFTDYIAKSLGQTLQVS